MRVEIKGNVYGMSRKEYKQFLKIASKAIPCGIYAAEKGSTAIMLNEKYGSIEDLRKSVSEYKLKGFKVYYNDKNNDKKILKTLNKTLDVFMLTLILLVLIAGLRIILELLFGVKMTAIAVFALMFVCIFVLNFLKG